jgi:hypothetical protein
VLVVWSKARFRRLATAAALLLPLCLPLLFPATAVNAAPRHANAVIGARSNSGNRSSAAGPAGDVTVSVSPNDAVNVSGVVYEVGFTTSVTGALGDASSITLAFPDGTGLVNSFVVKDTTSGQSSYEDASITGATAVIPTSGLSIAAGDQVQVTINDVANDSHVGANTVTVSTSSDTDTATGSYTLVAQHPLPAQAQVSVQDIVSSRKIRTTSPAGIRAG